MEGYLHSLTDIRLFPDMGRGVVSRYTINDSDIILDECELLVLNENDTDVVNTTDLRHYTFKFNDKQDCLVLGIGEMFNHSDKPNVSYKLVDRVENGETRKVMQFKLLQPVKAGEQLFIDYRADVVIDATTYIKSKSMMG